MYNHPKRFPAPCRFFTKGYCRDEERCQFSHLLPFREESPTLYNVMHSNSTQRAIRDVELDLLQKNYQHCVRRTSESNKTTDIHMTLPPIEGTLRSPLWLVLSVPHNYPDEPSFINIQNTDANNPPKELSQKAADWHQLRQLTLVQQLAWFAQSEDKHPVKVL